MIDIQMTEDEFRLFRDFIHKECGLYFGNGKKSFLCSRISKRVESVSLKSFYRYYRYLQGNGADEEAELMRLLDILTINETGYKLQANGPVEDPEAPELAIDKDIPKKGDNYDTEALTAELWEIKRKASQHKNIMIFPAADIPVEHVINTMDATREMPSIINRNKRVPLFTRPVLSEIIK